MRIISCILPLVTLTACSMRHAHTDAEDVSADAANPEVIVRRTSWEDAELAAKGMGRMEFSVRVADYPSRVIESALIRSKPAGTTDRPKQMGTDARGYAKFDSIPIGRYDIDVLAIGYGPAKVVVEVLAGCRTDVEAYLGIQAMGLFEVPRQPSRVRITTCKAGR